MPVLESEPSCKFVFAMVLRPTEKKFTIQRTGRAKKKKLSQFDTFSNAPS